jgi:hypothetical protein
MIHEQFTDPDFGSPVPHAIICGPVFLGLDAAREQDVFQPVKHQKKICLCLPGTSIVSDGLRRVPLPSRTFLSRLSSRTPSLVAASDSRAHLF